MTKKQHVSVLLTLAALVAAPAYAQKPQIQWDPDYDFGAVSTFAWQSTPETSLETEDPFMHARVVTAIEYYMTKAGWRESAINPDVYVTYHTKTDTRIQLRSDSFGYGFGGYGMGGWGYAGYGFGGPVSTTTRVYEYDEDTLIIDVWDRDTNTLVFRGDVTRVFSQTPQKAAKQVDKAIDKMAKRAEKLMASD
ncbi:MAG: DUF4136 domain-containing protein [Gammaproteobacteria bacterium]